jgi:hypothetical protein
MQPGPVEPLVSQKILSTVDCARSTISQSSAISLPAVDGN